MNSRPQRACETVENALTVFPLAQAFTPGSARSVFVFLSPIYGACAGHLGNRDWMKPYVVKPLKGDDEMSASLPRRERFG